MDVWMKSLVYALIDEAFHWDLKIVSFDGDRYDAIVPMWYL